MSHHKVRLIYLKKNFFYEYSHKIHIHHFNSLIEKCGYRLQKKKKNLICVCKVYSIIYTYQFIAKVHGSILVGSFFTRTTSTENTNSFEL